jgi:glycosyltransferase involved in cell wall biosynthesis
MRIAWFSPLPPSRSGIAAYSAELLPHLAPHAIEAFVDDSAGQDAVGRTAAIDGVTVRGAHDFPWRHARRPYDAIVYHVGNDLCHDYMWPYLVRYPGLLVLHDAQLHQARAQGLIRQHREADFKAEFSYCYPDASPLLADLVIAGLGGTLCYFWPMVRIPIESARVVAVHNAYLARELGEEFPGRPVRPIHLGVRDPQTSAMAPARDVRHRHGIPDDAVVFGSFGRVTPEKGLSGVVQALAQVAPALPSIRLLIVGEVPAYFDLMAEARQWGVADYVIETGYVGDNALPEYLSAVDVCLNLRWPTGRETSAAWIRCLAAGKPTVITDLVHLTDVPSLDLRSMKVESTTATAAEPVCVHVELVDGAHMLRLALRRLAEDAELRQRLGRAARQYWEDRGTIDLMARDYEALLAEAQAAPDPVRPARWPAHLTADGSSTARGLLAELGVSYPLDQPCFAGGSGTGPGRCTALFTSEPFARQA